MATFYYGFKNGFFKEKRPKDLDTVVTRFKQCPRGDGPPPTAPTPTGLMSLHELKTANTEGQPSTNSFTFIYL